jgi:hypothetical protein
MHLVMREATAERALAVFEQGPEAG